MIVYFKINSTDQIFQNNIHAIALKGVEIMIAAQILLFYFTNAAKWEYKR